MGPVVLLLALIGFMVLLAYLNFPPPYAQKKLVSVFNYMVLAVCGVLCLSWVLYMRSSHIHTSNENLWLPLAILGALGIEVIFLSFCFVLRNFWVFRPPRRPGQDGFFGF